MFRFVMVGALTASLAFTGGLAHAQARRSVSAPFIIQAATTWSDEERVARPDEPLLVQSLTANRWVKLEDSVEYSAMMSGSGVLAPGTPLFGTWSEQGGWVYCSVPKSKEQYQISGRIPCLQDANEDGAFDTLRLAMSPNAPRALAIVGDGMLRDFWMGAPKPLPKPVQYLRMAYTDAPAIDFKVEWAAIRPKTSRKEPLASPTGVSVFATVGMTYANQWIWDDVRQVTLDDKSAGKVKFRGAEIEVLGFTVEGGLRYRVVKPMPLQLATFTIPNPPEVTTIYIYQ